MFVLVPPWKEKHRYICHICHLLHLCCTLGNFTGRVLVIKGIGARLPAENILHGTFDWFYLCLSWGFLWCLKSDFCWCIGGNDFAADTEDGPGARGLDDAADGRWPMVMELFTKMQKLMLAWCCDATACDASTDAPLVKAGTNRWTLQGMYCVNGGTVFFVVYHYNQVLYLFA